MSSDERYVYLLFITRSHGYGNDYKPRWSDGPEPGEVRVFDDAWSAIDAARAELNEIEKTPVEPAQHDAGTVWIGGYDKTWMIVRRQRIEPG